MAHRALVLAVFDDEALADSAAAALRASGAADGDAIGVLTLDVADGEVKQDKVGARSSGKGAGIGTALWLLGPVGAIVGVGGGVALGALHHKGLKLDDDDRARISSQLTDGKAAVGVLTEEEDVASISGRLAELGGQPEAHEVSEEELQEAAAELPTTATSASATA